VCCIQSNSFNQPTLYSADSCCHQTRPLVDPSFGYPAVSQLDKASYPPPLVRSAASFLAAFYSQYIFQTHSNKSGVFPERNLLHILRNNTNMVVATIKYVGQ
jgi:hypothetical protein